MEGVPVWVTGRSPAWTRPPVLGTRDETACRNRVAEWDPFCRKAGVALMVKGRSFGHEKSPSVGAWD
jgi:hypothetical protein